MAEDENKRAEKQMREMFPVLREMLNDGVITDWEHVFLRDQIGKTLFTRKQREIIAKIYYKSCKWEEPVRKRKQQNVVKGTL